MYKEPSLSILIPTFNRENVLAETLDSLISQTFSNWECTLVDDGSSDGTLKIIENYIQKDARFSFYKRPETYKKGGCGARNFAFTKSKGTYIKWLDSDDILEKELLEKEIEILTANPAIDFVFCSHQTFSKEEIASSKTQFPDLKSYSGIELLNELSTSRKYILLGTYTLRREIISKSGLWNEELKINQDGEFLFRVLTSSKNAMSLSYIGFNYRIGGENKITSNSDTDKEKIRNKLKTWVLIDSEVKKSFTPDLLPYINGYKEFLYKYYLHLNQFDSIIEFRDFFKDQIKNENRRGIKIKLLKTSVLAFFSR